MPLHICCQFIFAAFRNESEIINYILSHASEDKKPPRHAFEYSYSQQNKKKHDHQRCCENAVTGRFKCGIFNKNTLLLYYLISNINFICHSRVGFLHIFALGIFYNLFRSKMPFPDMRMFLFPVPGSEIRNSG